MHSRSRDLIICPAGSTLALLHTSLCAFFLGAINGYAIQQNHTKIMPTYLTPSTCSAIMFCQQVDLLKNLMTINIVDLRKDIKIVNLDANYFFNIFGNVCKIQNLVFKFHLLHFGTAVRCVDFPRRRPLEILLRSYIHVFRCVSITKNPPGSVSLSPCLFVIRGRFKGSIMSGLRTVSLPHHLSSSWAEFGNGVPPVREPAPPPCQGGCLGVDQRRCFTHSTIYWTRLISALLCHINL
jgi:hypothetical protein